MHVYASILDPYEPPRPARIYDNPQVVRRSLLSQQFAGFRRAAATPLTVSTAGRPVAGANRRARTVERGDLAGRCWVCVADAAGGFASKAVRQRRQ